MGIQSVGMRCLCLVEITSIMVAPCPPWKSAAPSFGRGSGECCLDRWQLLLWLPALLWGSRIRKGGKSWPWVRYPWGLPKVALDEGKEGGRRQGILKEVLEFLKYEWGQGRESLSRYCYWPLCVSPSPPIGMIIITQTLIYLPTYNFYPNHTWKPYELSLESPSLITLLTRFKEDSILRRL